MTSSYAFADQLKRKPDPAPAPVLGSVSELWDGPGPHLIDMRILCRVLLDDVATRAALQHVKVRLSLSDSPVRVIGYATPLGTAVHRLLTNALDGMPTGGTLTVRVLLDPYVVLECCDTASAIPDGQVPELWRRRRSSDDGLALYKTKAIIESHRGHIWYRQQPGGGRCFIIELPVAGPRGIVVSRASSRP